MADVSLCAVQDCIKPAYLGDLCAMHRTRMHRHGTTVLPPRKIHRKSLSEILGGATQFGDLTVVGEEDGPTTPGNGSPRLLRCRCVCGNVKLYPLGNVKRGLSRGCGCKRGARVARSKLRHGHNTKARTSPEYRSWAHAIGRCENPNDGAYANYGGRGIKICARWRGSFEAFLADMGPRPSDKHSIDRIDVNGDYEPSNCRWATKHTQDRNRRTNRMLTLGVETKCLKDWAGVLGIQRTTLERRLAKGWTVEKALTHPIRNRAV